MVAFLFRCTLTFALVCHSLSLHTDIPLYRFKRNRDTSWSDPNDCSSSSRQPVVMTPSSSHNFTLDLRMPAVSPRRPDTYLCTAVPAPAGRDSYIVDFVPHASMDTAHHMLLFGCQKPFARKGYWDCGTERTCDDEAAIMYAWGRNAPPTKLPKDVGFKVGGTTRISYFVLQIHYGDVHAFRNGHKDCSGIALTMTTKPQPFIAGMYLLMSADTVIPPGKKVTNSDVSCQYDYYPIYPFAFRTHTHQLGKVVSGYRVRDGNWTLIGRQSPLLPQAFYAAQPGVEVKRGDTIAARCVFTGEGRTKDTEIGGTAGDEMCNFYIMYYMESRHSTPYMSCMDPGSKELFRHIPAEANVPIAVGPGNAMSMAHMSHGAPPKEEEEDEEEEEEEEDGPENTSNSGPAEREDDGDFYSLLSKLLAPPSPDVVRHAHRYDPPGPTRGAQAQAHLVAQIDSIMQKKALGWPSPRLGHPSREDPVLVRDRVHKFHQLEAAAARPRGSQAAAAAATTAAGADQQGYHLEEAPSWPSSALRLGQVSGVALDTDDNLVIFHRGDHEWDASSFDGQARYQQSSQGPIQQSTILVVDPATGTVLKASGRNMFYLPHGITTDQENHYWVTDVALHQVFKLSSEGAGKVLVELGKAFMPGSDSSHFCKPTDVAVDQVTGNIYVSDGYCNARILKFSPEGKYLSEWGAGYAGVSNRRRRVPFQIPHSLVYLPDRQELCVADRENGRIQCFVADTGQFVKEIKRPEFQGEVFAVSYSTADGGLLYAVNGESPYDGVSAPPQGFVINYSTKEIVDTFSPSKQDFVMPHDLVVNKDGVVFVGDAGSNSVIKFTSAKTHRSVKKGGIEVQEVEEIEAFVQTNVKHPALHKVSLAVAAVASQQKPVQTPPTLLLQQQHKQDEEKKGVLKQTGQQVATMSPAVVTTLLLIPLVLIISMGVFLRWRKSRPYGDGCDVKLEPNSTGGILGKLRGKAAGGLNLGNFFASHKGYTRQGFDRLSTEGSDGEKDDATDSENEEYSAPPPPPPPPTFPVSPS